MRTPSITVVIAADTRPLRRSMIDAQMVVAGPLARIRLHWLRWRIR